MLQIVGKPPTRTMNRMLEAQEIISRCAFLFFADLVDSTQQENKRSSKFPRYSVLPLLEAAREHESFQQDRVLVKLGK